MEANTPRPAGSSEVAPSLPIPEPNQSSPEANAAEVVAPSPERASESSETANQNQGMPLPPVAQQPQSVVTDPKAPPAPPVPAPVVDDSPAVADDVDVLEKEWVNKAKVIVDQTRQDPYEQERQAIRLQASYLKKRYGKEIRMSGEEAA